MDGTVTVSPCGESLQLLPERAIYWKRKGILFATDLHLGRVESLQKRDKPVPAGDTEEIVQRLSRLIKTFAPRSIYILGDLFHRSNSINEVIESLRSYLDAATLNILKLVPGNHDRNVELISDRLQVEILSPPVTVGPFSLTHEPTESSSHYNLAGHLHPMIDLETSTERLKRPCFRFDPQGAVLPAFTSLANGVVQEPKPGRQLFADAGEEVIEC